MKKTIFDSSLKLEWLEVNRYGSYSSSSICNCNARKYHGLLVSNIGQPNNKYVLLSQIEEALIFEKDKKIFFNTNIYEDTIYPKGYQHLYDFSFITHPVFYYQIGQFKLKKEIILSYSDDTVFIKYTCLEGIGTCVLRLAPLLAFRHFHQLTKENFNLQSNISYIKDGVIYRPYNALPSIALRIDAVTNFKKTCIWNKKICYPAEKDRGYEFKEDLFNPCLMDVFLAKDEEVIFCASTNTDAFPIKTHLKLELSRRKIDYTSQQKGTIKHQLQNSANRFINYYRANNSPFITAGYHWFGEWGRDTLISLPGLTLYNQKSDDFLSILKRFASFEKEGLLPNIFGDSIETSAYNSVDTSLWFMWAIQQYLFETKDYQSIHKYLWQTLKNIYSKYRYSKEGYFENNKEGLINILDSTAGLTWMDAMVDNKSVIDRSGLAVDINALWLNFLGSLLDFADRFNDDIKNEVATFFGQVKNSFLTVFWLEKEGYLADVVKNNHCIKDVRPNQLLAISLPFSAVSKARSKLVLKIVENQLLTPVGLRSLSNNNPGYKKKYFGNQTNRDLAYHNGTIWPWLLGHYVDALLKVNDKKTVNKKLMPIFTRLEKHMAAEGGIGHISEIFDGDRPHQARGCIAQAWSVAELLRAINKIGG